MNVTSHFVPSFFLLRSMYHISSITKNLQKQHTQTLVNLEWMSKRRATAILMQYKWLVKKFQMNTNKRLDIRKYWLFSIFHGIISCLKRAREKGHFDWKQTPLFIRLRCNHLIQVVGTVRTEKQRNKCHMREKNSDNAVDGDVGREIGCFLNARVLTTIICANSRSTTQSIHHSNGLHNSDVADL